MSDRAGLNLNLVCVRSMFVSRWNETADNNFMLCTNQHAWDSRGGEHLRGVSQAASSRRWQRAYNFGVRQRLLWISTTRKDQNALPLSYVHGPAAPLTANPFRDRPGLPKQTINQEHLRA